MADVELSAVGRFLQGERRDLSAQVDRAKTERTDARRRIGHIDSSVAAAGMRTVHQLDEPETRQLR